MFFVSSLTPASGVNSNEVAFGKGKNTDSSKYLLKNTKKYVYSAFLYESNHNLFINSYIFN